MVIVTKGHKYCRNSDRWAVINDRETHYIAIKTYRAIKIGYPQMYVPDSSFGDRLVKDLGIPRGSDYVHHHVLLKWNKTRERTSWGRGPLSDHKQG
jgi:hypothetical protein